MASVLKNDPSHLPISQWKAKRYAQFACH